MYRDETLSCIDCGRPFAFTVGEQEFFAMKGFANKPNRCPDCRAARKAMRPQSTGNTGHSRREMFAVTCSQCGRPDQVPFQPRTDRPVYCRDCFSAKQAYR
ncbi:MAG TPA: zinc-ribbon domain containing protein [Candidatus Acidoferrales bacterium]|nr:zinc-ribbon domain containing protein [Candidatus Acidoferrales bacterium]